MADGPLPPVAQYKWPTPASTAVEPWMHRPGSPSTRSLRGHLKHLHADQQQHWRGHPGDGPSTDFGRVWRLQPAAQSEDTWFTVKVTGGFDAIRDLAGNPSASTSWRSSVGIASIPAADLECGAQRNGHFDLNHAEHGLLEAITGITPTTFTLKACWRRTHSSLRASCGHQAPASGSSPRPLRWLQGRSIDHLDLEAPRRSAISPGTRSPDGLELHYRVRPGAIAPPVQTGAPDGKTASARVLSVRCQSPSVARP